MAICVEFNIDGVLAVVAGSLPIAQCPAFVLIEAADYQQIVMANNLFALPASQDFAAAWGVGFVLPVTLYLVTWAVASVVNFFK